MLPGPRVAALLLTVLAVSLAGCGNADRTATPPSSPGRTSTTEPPPLPAGAPPAPGAVGVSAGGVTTKVDVPSDATESQFGQACHAARLWMDGRPGDRATLAEPYLETVQAPGFRGPGNFNTPWAELTPAQQAGVILAADGAAAGTCE